MSIKGVIKMMEEIRDFGKSEGVSRYKMKKLTNTFADRIRNRLIDGVLNGYDIDGKTFKGIEDSTENIRRHKQRIGTQPLRDTGGLLNFLQSDNFMHVTEAKIVLKDAPDKWDVHNRDHYVPNNATKYNTQGKFVPARKWYGIPKTYREGGTKYNELVREFIKTIEEDFKKISKLR